MFECNQCGHVYSGGTLTEKTTSEQQHHCFDNSSAQMPIIDTDDDVSLTILAKPIEDLRIGKKCNNCGTHSAKKTALHEAEI